MFCTVSFHKITVLFFFLATFVFLFGVLHGSKETSKRGFGD